MSVLWTAINNGLAIGNEWARGNAADYQGGAPHDPSVYTGNRYAYEADTADLFPKHSTLLRLTQVGNESGLWTQSFAARAALGLHNGGSPPPGVDRLEYQGDTRWCAFWVYFPAAFIAPSNFTNLMQRKGQGTGNGPFGMKLATNTLSLVKSQTQTSGTTDTGTVWSATIQRDKWLYFNLGVFWSTGSDGWYEFWGDLNDGQGLRQLKAKTNGWTSKTGTQGQAVGLDLNVYRGSSGSGNASQGTIYQTGVAMATTRVEADTASLYSTTPVNPPATPSAPSASQSSGTVTINWTAVATATSYKVWRRPQVGTTTWTQVGSATSATQAVDSPGVGTWEYSVSALNSGGAESAKSGPSNAVTTTNIPPIIVPAGPIDIPAELTYIGTKETAQSGLSVTAYPHYTQSDGSWLTTGASGWQSGFFPALFWRLFGLTANTTWRDQAINRQAGIAAQKTNVTSAGADLGHRMKPFMLGFEQIVTRTTDRDTVITAADTVNAAYNSTVTAIRSWTGTVNGISAFNTIIDSLTAAEIMPWAARNGSANATSLRANYKSHVKKVIANHIRSDGSVWQVVQYDTTSGAATVQSNVQGSTSGVWSRGQAWAVYGLAVAYREIRAVNSSDTDLPGILAAAVNVATYFSDNLPSDLIPYWDFTQTTTADPRDTSAAAIAAVGMYELANWDASQDWAALADQIMQTLATQHSADTAASLLAHGTSNKNGPIGVDVGLIYGDSYFLNGLATYSSRGSGTTKPLKSLVSDSTWSAWPTRAGSAVVDNTGVLKLNIGGSVSTAVDLIPTLDGVRVGAFSTPTRVTGSGTVEFITTLDDSLGNSIEIKRIVTLNSSGTITAQVLEWRLKTGGVDSTPTRIAWSALASGANRWALGFPSGGNVSLQLSTNGTTWVENANRTPSSAFDFTRAWRATHSVNKPFAADTITISDVTVASTTGVDDPTPSSVSVISPASVPDPNGFAVVSSGLDPAAPTTGIVSLSVAAPVTNSSIQFTPDALPIRFGYVDGDPTGTVTWSAFQSSTTYSVNNQPVSPADVDPFPRYWTVQYRNNGSPSAITGNQATPIPVTIQASGTISKVTGLDGIRIAGGSFRLFWDPNPPDQNIGSYAIFIDVNDQTALTKTTPDKQETGILQSPGTTILDSDGTVKDIGGKLASSTFSGYDDAVTVYAYVLARTAPPTSNTDGGGGGTPTAIDGGGASSIFTLTLDGGPA